MKTKRLYYVRPQQEVVEVMMAAPLLVESLGTLTTPDAYEQDEDNPMGFTFD